MEEINNIVAILVINYNGRKHLKTCFESLRNQIAKRYEIFLIDNGSSDDSVSYVESHFPEVQIIRFDKNLGFAEAYNRAVKMVKLPYVAFLNNDVEVHPGWLRELLMLVNTDKNVAIWGSKILLYDRRDILHSAGGCITPIGGALNLDVFLKEKKNSNLTKYIGVACGAAMMVKRDIFLDIGGFDADYFAYFEDSDLCWRAWLYGYKIMHVPSSIIYHKLRGSFKSVFREYLGTKNRLTSAFKNFGRYKLIQSFILSLLFDIRKMIQLIYIKKFNIILAIIKGYYVFLKSLPGNLKKRRIIQRSRKITDAELIKRGILLTLNDSINHFKRLNPILRDMR